MDFVVVTGLTAATEGSAYALAALPLERHGLLAERAFLSTAHIDVYWAITTS
jgi:hypothetical protein